MASGMADFLPRTDYQYLHSCSSHAQCGSVCISGIGSVGILICRIGTLYLASDVGRIPDNSGVLFLHRIY